MLFPTNLHSFSHSIQYVIHGGFDINLQHKLCYKSELAQPKYVYFQVYISTNAMQNTNWYAFIQAVQLLQIYLNKCDQYYAQLFCHKNWYLFNNAKQT